MNLLTHLDPDLCRRLLLTLAHSLWQATAILGLAIIAAAALRKSGPGVRYRVYVGGLLIAAVCPMVTFALLPATKAAQSDRAAHAPAVAIAPPAAQPRWPSLAAKEIPVSTSLATPAAPTIHPSAPSAASPAGSIAAAPPPPAAILPPPSSQPLWPRFAPALVAAYFIGVVLMLARLLLGLHGGRRLRRRAQPIEDSAFLEMVLHQARRVGMSVAPAVARSARVAVPVVVGVIRPMILLPAAMLAGLPPDDLKAILTHELAHLRRRDHVVNLLQRLVEAGLFFNPAIWLLSARIRAEREYCCDDLVVLAGGRSLAYARSLVRAAELCLPQRGGDSAGPFALAAIGGPSALRRRVLRLLGNPVPDLRLARGGVVTTLLLALLAITVFWRHAPTRASDAPGAKLSPATQPATYIGILTDPDGRPLSHAYVASAGANIWYGVRTDLAGRFELKDVKPDQTHWAAWSQRSGRMALFSLPEAPAKEPFTVVAAYHEADADVRVVDTTGRPLPRVKVQFVLTTPDGAICSSDAYEDKRTPGYQKGVQIPTGPGLTIKAVAAGQGETPAIAADRASDLELPDLVIAHPTTQPSAYAFEEKHFGGVVVDETGKPVVGALIDITAPQSVMMTVAGEVRTGPDGRWSRRLPPGIDPARSWMTVSHPDFITMVVNDNNHAPPLQPLLGGTAKFVLKRGATLSGTVRDAEGKPVFNALVQAGEVRNFTPGPENEPFETAGTPRTDREGHFVATGLPPGPRQIVISTDDYAPALVTVNIGAPDLHPRSLPLNVTLDRGKTLTGRVVDADGKPIEGATIGCNDWMTPGLFAPQRHGLTRTAVSNSDGRFTLDHLPSVGTLQLYASKKGADLLISDFDWNAQVPDRGPVTLYARPAFSGRVLDADTGQPVRRFDITFGWDINGDGKIEWLALDGVKHVKAEDGAFHSRINNVDLSPDDHDSAFVAKITADGYAPQLTPSLRVGEKPSPLTIRLHKSTPMPLTVQTPSGAPAANATVAWVGPNRIAMVVGVGLDENLAYMPELILHTGADGACSLPPRDPVGRLLVLHDGGYAILSSSELKSGSVIKLTGWGRVEGVVYKARRPAPTVALRGAVIPMMNTDRSGGEINFQLSATSLADGSFSIDHVPALAGFVAWDSKFQTTNPAYFVAEPGKTARVELGRGRTMAGKLDFGNLSAGVKPDGIEAVAYRLDPPSPPVGWSDQASWRSALSRIAHAPPETSDPTWAATPPFAADISADGSARIDGLPPGRYVLYVRAHEPPPPNVCGTGRVAAEARTEFTVPEGPDDVPLPLPSVKLSPVASARVGDEAPPIDGKTLAGESFSLQSLRGKLVLLDFWASWCGPCRQSTPALKPIAERYAKEGHLAVVGINLDFESAPAQKFVGTFGLTWPQVMLGGWDSSNPVLRAYGISSIPSLWLISADGKVLAKDLPPDQVDAAVEKAIRGG